MPKDQPQDIERVRRDEQSRGKKIPPDHDKVRAERERIKQSKDILREMTWRDVKNALGLRPGTAEYESLYQIWRSYRCDLADVERQPARPKPRKP